MKKKYLRLTTASPPKNGRHSKVDFDGFYEMPESDSKLFIIGISQRFDLELFTSDPDLTLCDYCVK